MTKRNTKTTQKGKGLTMKAGKGRKEGITAVGTKTRKTKTSKRT